MIRWLVSLWQAWREPFDIDDDRYPDSYPDQDEHGMDCPDTEPTSPGALDTLPGRLQ